MNGYIAFWNHLRAEVHADTLLEAKEKAVAHFQVGRSRKVKPSDVTVMLAEINGEPYIHTAVD